MNPNKDPRSVSVKRLLDAGFRVQFSDDLITVLCKPQSHSTLYIAQVSNDGNVNTQPLTTFLETLLT